MKKKVMQDVVEEKVEAEDTAVVNETVAEEPATVEEVAVAEAVAVAEVAAEEPAAAEEVAAATEEVPTEESAPKSDSGKPGVGAKVKEWFRKQIVSLKKAPQRIPMLFLLIASLCYMLILFNYSKTINQSVRAKELSATGLCVFIVTLLSLLVLVSYLNAFPKRKKVNWFFIGLVIAMVAAMVACDILVYVQLNNNANAVIKTGQELGKDLYNTSNYDPLRASFKHTILHLVFLGIFAIVFACLPLIKMGLNKINTKKVVESAASNMKEEIDLQE